MFQSVITGTGSYLPTEIKTNTAFDKQPFYMDDNRLLPGDQKIIIDKFEKITGIKERRYVSDNLNTSDIAALAGFKALENSGIDTEQLDTIIVAHNFGNVEKGSIQTDAVPSLANRVKYSLHIQNPACVCYDLLFGCPGWIQGMIQADAFFKAGLARKALVIGAETLSRVVDVFDRDSMIFSDGAGAAVLEYQEVGDQKSGILSTCAVSHCTEETFYIYMGISYSPDSIANARYMKMKGRKVYEYALKHVPIAIKSCIDKSGVSIETIKKIFIHQANEKLDEAILQALYKLYGYSEAPKGIMPMSIHYLGNSSVATVPTLYDLVTSGKDADHQLKKGDVIVFASVGAGMNINAITYRV